MESAEARRHGKMVATVGKHVSPEAIDAFGVSGEAQRGTDDEYGCKRLVDVVAPTPAIVMLPDAAGAKVL